MNFSLLIKSHLAGRRATSRSFAEEKPKPEKMFRAVFGFFLAPVIYPASFLLRTALAAVNARFGWLTSQTRATRQRVYYCKKIIPSARRLSAAFGFAVFSGEFAVFRLEDVGGWTAGIIGRGNKKGGKSARFG